MLFGTNFKPNIFFYRRIKMPDEGKASIFSKWAIKESTRQLAVISKKNQNQKSQFSDEFCSFAPIAPRARTKNCLFEGFI
jgi:hypothetical protein